VNSFLAVLISITSQVITILVIIHVILSYFMAPFHPIRQAIDRIIDPILTPIRQILPQTGMIDFSPLVLLILVQVVARILLSFL
jgi:YggT family protein